MARPIVEIKRKKVRSGLELQGISRSDRGTKYIVDSVVVETTGRSKEEVNRLVAAAIAEILSDV